MVVQNNDINVNSFLVKNLNVLYWNASGIKDKFLELINVLEQHDIQIALINETWLEISDKLPYNTSFFMYRLDRTDTIRGGVAILVRKNIKHNLKTTYQNLNLIEAIGVTVFTNRGEIDFISAYFPGASSPVVKNRCARVCGNNIPANITKLFGLDIKNLIKSSRWYPIICGDFNARNTIWNCLRNNQAGNALLKLTQLNTDIKLYFPSSHTYQPTKRKSSPSTLDLVITNNTNYLSSISVQNHLNSDHLPVTFAIKLCPVSRKPQARFNYNLADWNMYRHFINSSIDLESIRDIVYSNEVDAQSVANKLLQNFNSIVLQARNISVPKYSVLSLPQKLPDDILQLKTIRNRLRRRFSRHHNPVDKSNIKALSFEISTRIRKWYLGKWSKFIENINDDEKSNHNKKLWLISKKLSKSKGSEIPGLNTTNTNGNSVKLITDTEKTDLFASEFARIFNQPSNNPNLNVNFQNELTELQLTLDQPLHSTMKIVKPKELMSLIKQLKIRKVPGIDGIETRLLKNIPKKAIILLCYIFNFFLGKCYFPNQWKLSKTIAIPKPGKDKSDPKNYRPISLLCITGKMFEKVIYCRIQEIMQDIEIANPPRKIIPNHQFGFMPQLSCNHQVNRLINHVKNNRNILNSTGLVALDIEKAFDSVWHEGLLIKLLKFKFPPHVIKMISSFLKERKFQVHYKTARSKIVPINNGVPQGSILSPVLYNIYVGDIPTPKYCEIANFADDTIIYTSADNANQIIDHLESDYEQIINYFRKWKIQINHSKTNAIFFTRRRLTECVPQRNLNLNNINIPWQSTIKYLGITLDKRLTFSPHIDQTIKKTKITVRNLYSLLNRKSILSLDKKLLLFKSVIQPIMLYGSPSWGRCAITHIKKLQIQQNKCLKLITNKPYFFSTRLLHENTGVKPIQDKISKLTNNFNLKLQYIDNPLITVNIS